MSLAAKLAIARSPLLSKAPTIRRLDAAGMEAHIAALSGVLMDCVEGGASVGFMAPLTRERADAFWRGIRDRVAAGASEVLVAELDGEVLGTVQLAMAQPENQPHRADLAKMLVHRRARKRGLGRALLAAAEDLARARGKTLLVLDTASDDAERLYESQAWTRVGTVPGYALLPDGGLCDTVIFISGLGLRRLHYPSEGLPHDIGRELRPTSSKSTDIAGWQRGRRTSVQPRGLIGTPPIVG
jgi:GNAT superfamily N-acetyltransferase